MPSFVSIRLAAKNPKFCHFFGLPHFVLSPVVSNLRKLNTGAQLGLQTFPYPTALWYYNTYLFFGK